MRIFFISDIHSGLNKNTNRILENYFNEIKSQYEIDFIALGGDLGCNQIRQIEITFRVLRRVFPDHEIGTVFGNHDYWETKAFGKGKRNGKIASPMDIFKYQKRYLEDYNISDLRLNPKVTSKVAIYGIDGWTFYEGENLRNGDNYSMPKMYMGDTFFDFLKKEDGKALSRISLDSDRLNILVTHMPPYLGGSFINEKGEDLTKSFDVILTGHTHEEMDQKVNKSRIINTGPDYNKPRGILYDSESNTIKFI